MKTQTAHAAIAQSPPVQTQLQDGIFRLSLNRPEKRNCLSEEMLLGVQHALDEAQANPAARVIVVDAAGPAFCAGHDLKQLTAARQNADAGRDYFSHIMQLCATVMQSIVGHRLPVIAQVEGIATAAGCQLVASCDLALASHEARFATPGVHIGLFCSTPMVALSRNVHHKHAMEMLITGDMVSAERAAEIGLINRAVSAEQIDNEINAWAQSIVAKSEVTLKIGKQAFYQQAEMDLSRAYDFAAGVMVENMLKPDAEEGINAFIEKRQPKWQA